VADYITLFAMTDKSQGHRGISAFIVDTRLPGFAHGKVEPKLGIRASHTSELIFEDYRLPAFHRLGKEGDGFKIALSILDAGRIGIAAQSVGIAEAAYEAALDYAKERVQFGQPIASFQAVQWMLADMKTRIEAARLLTYQAALAKDEAKKTGERFSLEASMAKLFASESAMWVTTKAVQIFGGNGYSKEYPVERYFRDAKITEIYEGTSEIQRLVISRSILS
jgi:alkylation response protein AidB-like acyl-CoA dehydrogenase